MEEQIQKKKPIDLVLMSTLYKIIIPEEVESKIRFICNKVWDVEWSGTLFYTYTGSFDDGSLVITAKDIYVMDIGTTGYTEFDMSPSVISYMTEHPELLDCQMGLIHSHNNMATFISGTDADTLREEGKDRNHFVSLIVNNTGTYTAAITRFVKSIRDIRESLEYNTYGDEHKEFNKQYYETYERLEYYKLQIIKKDVTGFDELNSQLEGIKLSKANKPTKFDTFTKNSEIKPNTSFSSHNYPSTSLEKQTIIPFEDEEDELDFHFDEELMKSIALQLVTGSIVIPNNSTLDIVKWVNSMPSIYEKRFGNSKEGFEVYSLWVSMLVEFIMTNTEDKKLSDTFDIDLEDSILAQDLISYLSKFTPNKYLKAITDELIKYVV